MTCSIGRILQFKEAMQFNTISLINSAGENFTQNCQFCWSTDGVCWTNWTSYNNYLNICKNIDSDFYLRILFYSDLKSVHVGDVLTKCYNITLNTTDNIFLKNFCDDPNLFQPYNGLDCALQLQQQLSDSVVCMFGIPIYYFKVDPLPDSLDISFKEYVLHNVTDVKQIKLMIQDGQLPSSNYRLTEFDFDWETDWETEISKTQFASAFGDTAIPVRNDFVYVPMMKRMWEVNSAYDEKNEGLMWRSTTWKLSLTKYNESTNINADEFANIIDNFVETKYETDVLPLENNEQHRQVGADPISSPQFAGNNMFDLRMTDAVRKSSFGTVSINDQMICHKNKIISRNIYNLVSPDSGIEYQKGICGDSGTIMFIIYNNYSLQSYDILNFGEVKISIENISNDKYHLLFNNKSYELEKSTNYLVICRWSKDTYTTNLDIYKHVINPNIPEYLIRMESYWFDFEHPVHSDVSNYNLDYESTTPKSCKISGPIYITNIKYFNNYLPIKDCIIESLKYTTNNKKCVINDLARPITTGYGYLVR